MYVEYKSGNMTSRSVSLLMYHSPSHRTLMVITLIIMVKYYIVAVWKPFFKLRYSEASILPLKLLIGERLACYFFLQITVDFDIFINIMQLNIDV